jgi:hypothetical protein
VRAEGRTALTAGQPDSQVRRIPLAVFGTGPQTVAADGVLNFTLPGMVFAGQTFTQVTMAENGYAVLGSHETSDAGTNQSLPNATSPNAILAPFRTRTEFAAAAGQRTLITGVGVVNAASTSL